MIDEVSPEADRAKATVQVKVKILKPDDYLRPDMNATVAFYNEAKAAPRAEPKRVGVIPAGAVQNGSVFRNAERTCATATVDSGRTSAKGVLIESGLIGGEDLIVNPPANLKRWAEGAVQSREERRPDERDDNPGEEAEQRVCARRISCDGLGRSRILRSTGEISSR